MEIAELRLERFELYDRFHRNGIDVSVVVRFTHISASGVRNIWLRHTLQSRKLRLKALEAKVATEGIVLTEAQVAAIKIAAGSN